MESYDTGIGVQWEAPSIFTRPVVSTHERLFSFGISDCGLRENLDPGHRAGQDFNHGN